MKKLFTAILLLNFTSSFAASTLNMKGVVPVKLIALITPTPDALSLPLSVSQNDLKVATGKFKSNSGPGLKVTVSSTNLGNLKRVGGNELFPYSMKYGSVQIPLNQTFNYSQAGTLDIVDNFTISYTGQLSSNMTAGDYVDTITFTMTAL